MPIFKKIREQLFTHELVLEAIVRLLDKRNIIKRSEIQAEILDIASGDEGDTTSSGVDN